jgi:hypothetical protein
MARSKSTTGTKTTRNRAEDKSKREELTNAGISSTPDESRTAQTSSPETAAESAITNPPVSGDSTIATENKPHEPAHESGSPRKLGVVKSEPRKKVVVPINLEDEIRRRAYELYEQRGSAPGSEAEDWFTAEREVRERYQSQQQSA